MYTRAQNLTMETLTRRLDAPLSLLHVLHFGGLVFKCIFLNRNFLDL